ncbi:MAG: TetR/AcrR family transcriptional regulator [Gemmatimonadetes bacterium]|nr:TetR/AcrR family transcriptional regulator [Gemmatimonadota bacterium]
MSRSTKPETRKPIRGRPRSQKADDAILWAALDLLAESGYGRLTMEQIADRAGVGKATLYRRWKSCEEVVAAAVAGFVEGEIKIPDTGSVEEDLHLLVERAAKTYRGRPGRIMPGLLAAVAESDAVAHAVRTGFLTRRREALAAVLKRGIARGELAGDVDVELALDFLGGPLFYRLLVTGGQLDEAFVRGVVKTILYGLKKP